MKESVLLSQLKELAADDSTVRNLLVLVDRIFDESCAVMKTVVRNMPEYTLHDDVHLQRVVELMGRILPERTLRRLKPLEIGVLILAAALHDIGMAPSQDEIRRFASEGADPED